MIGAETIELINWLLHFGCAWEEFRFVVSNLADWMSKHAPPWATNFSLMECCLVSLDKCPGVYLVGMGETLCYDISNLVIRAAGDQAKPPTM